MTESTLPHLTAEHHKSAKSSTASSSPATSVTKKKIFKTKKKHVARKNTGSGSTTLFEPILMRADMDRYDSVAEVISHYVEMSELFPDIKLAVILEAEKRFYECDINRDGTIDLEEMDKMLMKQGFLYTDAQLKDIMKEIDVDNDNAIELIEYIGIIDKIEQRKRVNLPQALIKSKFCTIQ